ncbi:MAG: hypothetical protein KatS3mg049_1336 [Caldilinea sp.]|jgi:hypothetical protein|nr:MAG: hypothetical protein KatS3mg049_1336 [Caldilinea sp.]
MRVLKPKQPPAMPMNGFQQYIKLENRLVLLAWLSSLLK